MCLEICPSLLVFEPSDKEETLAARHMGLTDASGSCTDEKSVPGGGVRPVLKIKLLSQLIACDKLDGGHSIVRDVDLPSS